MNLSLTIFLLLQEIGRMERGGKWKDNFLVPLPFQYYRKQGQGFLLSLWLNFVSSYGKASCCILLCFLNRNFSKAICNSLKERKEQIDNNFLASCSLSFHLWWVWCPMERGQGLQRDPLPPGSVPAVPSKTCPLSVTETQAASYLAKVSDHRARVTKDVALYWKNTVKENQLLEWENPKRCLLASEKDLLSQPWLSLPATPAGDCAREKGYRSCSDRG